MNGLPQYAVAIALENREENSGKWGSIDLGVIYLPELDVLFSAIRGKGAWRDGEPVHIPAKERQLQLLSHWWPKEPDDHYEAWGRLVGRLLKEVTDIRNIGSPCAELAYAAEGTLGGFFARDMEPWDLAAGMLIIEEAGGAWLDPFHDNPLASGWICAGAKDTADWMRDVMRQEVSYS
ncbi:hypothetical protein GF324_05105 [bacterium]|nr:hypothetical protein [bacterium]